QDEAVHAIRLLSDAARGRANFFVLDALTDIPAPSSIPATDNQLIPALDIISVEEHYLPLCRRLLHNVFLLQSDDEKALESALPAEDTVILHKSGKFSKNKVGMAGGSVGLFEGK